MTPEQYKTNQQRNEDIPKSNQLSIDREAKTIFKTLQLLNRIECYIERPAFIS